MGMVQVHQAIRAISNLRLLNPLRDRMADIPRRQALEDLNRSNHTSRLRLRWAFVLPFNRLGSNPQTRLQRQRLISRHQVLRRHHISSILATVVQLPCHSLSRSCIQRNNNNSNNSQYTLIRPLHRCIMRRTHLLDSINRSNNSSLNSHLLLRRFHSNKATNHSRVRTMEDSLPLITVLRSLQVLLNPRLLSHNNNRSSNNNPTWLLHLRRPRLLRRTSLRPQLPKRRSTRPLHLRHYTEADIPSHHPHTPSDLSRHQVNNKGQHTRYPTHSQLLRPYSHRNTT